MKKNQCLYIYIHIHIVEIQYKGRHYMNMYIHSFIELGYTINYRILLLVIQML